MRILGITGTIGAGKGTIVRYLQQKHGFEHYSVRRFLGEELERQGLPTNRDHMTRLANELRAKGGPSYLVEQLYREAQKSGADCIIESIRTIGEIDALNQMGDFRLIAVDAPAELRYARVRERKSSTDHISLEKFIQDEAREMRNEDPNKQNLTACMKRADVLLLNSGGLETLEEGVERYMQQLQPSPTP